MPPVRKDHTGEFPAIIETPKRRKLTLLDKIVIALCGFMVVAVFSDLLR